MDEPRLTRIRIYPIKSLDAIEVAEARVLRGAGLEHDRRWAVADASGQFVNAKRTDAVHRLKMEIDPWQEAVAAAARSADERQVFHLSRQREAFEAWLGEHLGYEVRLLENTVLGFPDDTDASGPTIVSAATLAAVGAWFDEPFSIDQARERFRANLEIDGAPAFWEDRLYGEPGAIVRFAVGDVVFEGINPCARCVVPSRDPYTGAVMPRFQRTFAERRRETLPEWAPRSRFDHFYRLSVNTRTADRGGVIRVGDEVRLLAT